MNVIFFYVISVTLNKININYTKISVNLNFTENIKFFTFYKFLFGELLYFYIKIIEKFT